LQTGCFFWGQPTELKADLYFHIDFKIISVGRYVDILTTLLVRCVMVVSAAGTLRSADVASS